MLINLKVVETVDPDVPDRPPLVPHRPAHPPRNFYTHSRRRAQSSHLLEFQSNQDATAPHAPSGVVIPRLPFESAGIRPSARGGYSAPPSAHSNRRPHPDSSYTCFKVVPESAGNQVDAMPSAVPVPTLPSARRSNNATATMIAKNVLISSNTVEHLATARRSGSEKITIPQKLNVLLPERAVNEHSTATLPMHVRARHSSAASHKQSSQSLRSTSPKEEKREVERVKTKETVMNVLERAPLPTQSKPVVVPTRPFNIEPPTPAQASELSGAGAHQHSQQMFGSSFSSTNASAPVPQTFRLRYKVRQTASSSAPAPAALSGVQEYSVLSILSGSSPKEADLPKVADDSIPVNSPALTASPGVSPSVTSPRGSLVKPRKVSTWNRQSSWRTAGGTAGSPKADGKDRRRTQLEMYMASHSPLALSQLPIRPADDVTAKVIESVRTRRPPKFDHGSGNTLVSVSANSTPRSNRRGRIGTVDTDDTEVLQSVRNLVASVDLSGKLDGWNFESSDISPPNFDIVAVASSRDEDDSAENWNQASGGRKKKRARSSTESVRRRKSAVRRLQAAIELESKLTANSEDAGEHINGDMNSAPVPSERGSGNLPSRPQPVQPVATSEKTTARRATTSQGSSRARSPLRSARIGISSPDGWPSYDQAEPGFAMEGGSNHPPLLRAMTPRSTSTESPKHARRPSLSTNFGFAPLS